MRTATAIFSKLLWVLWGFWITLSVFLLLSKPYLSEPKSYPLSPTQTLLSPEISDTTAPPLQSPTLNHFWGTDELGRDLLSRLLFGTGYSLGFGVLVGLFTCLLGFFLGMFLSYLPFWVQHISSYFIELLSSLPLLPLALIGLLFYPGQVVIVAFLKIALGWGNIAQFTRLEAINLLRSPRFSAARSQGLSSLRIALKHLMPTLLPGALTFFPQVVFSSILSLATLDFFGLGFPIPTPTLSEMFRQFAENPEAWWLLFYPLVVITGLLMGFQTLECKVH